MTPKPGHVLAIDASRATAILGIVINHTWVSLNTNGIGAQEGFLATVNDAAVLARIPALCFFVGIFIPDGVRKRGTCDYLRVRTSTLLWVYLVWSSLQRALELVVPPARDSPREWWRPLTLWTPDGHFWFLPFLALATALVAWFRPWERTWALAVLLAGGLLLWGWSPPVLGLDGISNVAFLAAGASVGKSRTVGLMTHHPRAIVGFGVVASVAFVVLWSWGLVGSRSGEIVGLPQRIPSMIGAFLGVPILGALGIVLAAIPTLGRVVAWHLGRGSVTIVIYATHIMAIAGVRTFLEFLGVPKSSAWIYSIVCVAGGVTLPLLLHRAARAVGAQWLFEPPLRGRRQSSPR